MSSSPLRIRLARIEEENARLRMRLAYFERNSLALFGTTGEDFVASAAEGFKQSSRVASFDVRMPRGGRVEVKTSALNKLYPHNPSSKTKRWAWMRIMGTSGKKPFTHLALIGLVDERYRARYADPKAPYICFLIPRKDVRRFLIKSGTGPGIQLTTNPDTVRKKGRELYERFQVTERQLLTKLRRRTRARRRLD